MIKIGLTETLAFVTGFVYGSSVGFVTGSLIIVVSDLFVLPGAWTPFVAAIIGMLGVCGGMIRRISNVTPSFVLLAASAISLTLLSESLQNLWVALFYNIPVVAAMVTGVPSLATALVNNVILFTTVGMKIVKLLEDLPLKT